MSVFKAFELLVPKAEYMSRWPVVACDQFTSQPEYWAALENEVSASPSALRCILPEVELDKAGESRYEQIRDTMQQYLGSGIFRRFENSFVYVERTLINGKIRRGLVGVIDLEAYDFHADSSAPIRATERTVEERIPPRMKVRRGAKMELSHVLLLCDDECFDIIEPLSHESDKLETLYDQSLMMGGGHIRGYLVCGERADKLQEKIDAYCRRKAAQYGDSAPMLFAVGDGNHSLATAKACYEELKAAGADAAAIARARYAMVELQNIRDEVQVFEPIHRLMYDVQTHKLMAFLRETCCAERGYPIRVFCGGEESLIHLDRSKGLLPVGILQHALDEYLAQNPGRIDYIHGEDTLRELCRKPASMGFVLEAIPKGDFFRGIAEDGVLPRKTFSMGEAREKRYYLEAREI